MFFSLPHGAVNETGVPSLLVSGKLEVVVFAKERGCEFMLAVIDARDSKDANVRCWRIPWLRSFMGRVTLNRIM
jgi:hypothetical protein